MGEDGRGGVECWEWGCFRFWDIIMMVGAFLGRGSWHCRIFSRMVELGIFTQIPIERWQDFSTFTHYLPDIYSITHELQLTQTQVPSNQ